MIPENQPLPPVEIPAEALSSDALRGIIDEFISREGTDYGAIELSHDAKTQRVMKQLEKGDVRIVFDPNSESVTLLTLLDFNARRR